MGMNISLEQIHKVMRGITVQTATFPQLLQGNSGDGVKGVQVWEIKSFIVLETSRLLLTIDNTLRDKLTHIQCIIKLHTQTNSTTFLLFFPPSHYPTKLYFTWLWKQMDYQ